MDSSSGTSSNSSGLQNSGSEEDLQLVMDQRKRKRMISNRESARRSRIRKQKHLDDLTAQVAQLRNHNHQILAGVKLTMEQYVNVESENAILRAQAAELTHRLHSLLQIVGFCNDDSAHGFPLEHDAAAWNCLSQPIGVMAAPADSALLY